jgi:hypothetical protein
MQRIESMRSALASAQGQLELKIQQQAEVQAATDAQLASRIDALSARVHMLESTRRTDSDNQSTSIDAGATHVTSTSGRDLAFAIKEATLKIKAVADICKQTTGTNRGRRRQQRIHADIIQGIRQMESSARQPVRYGGARITRLVAQLQRDVQRRAALVAKLYEGPRPGVEYELH